MLAGVVGVAFCGYGEAGIVVACFAGEGLLLAADVVAGGVDFGVAVLLEGGEDGFVGGEGGYAGAFVD